MLIHLIRHGHVHNPRHVVYASLGGFGLSEEGKRQAATVADRLNGSAVTRIVSSPLERAIATAVPLARNAGLPITIDPDLSEWRLLDRWAGHTWEALGDAFPSEVAAYLDDPLALTFGDESLLEMAQRCAGAIRRHASDTGETVFVFHQDPVQAVTRTLLGQPLEDFHAAKPDHGEIRSFRSVADGWQRVDASQSRSQTPVPTL
jgi:broad specificity phosphatase PhoE